MAEAEAQVQAAQQDRAGIQTRALAALDFLRQHPAVTGPAVGLIGFSFGAAWSLVLSELRPEAVRAVVLFYGAYSVNFNQAQAAYLGHFAEQDEWEPLEGAREMEGEMVAAGRAVDLHVYPGTGHWFFEADRPADFRPEAAALAWDRTLSFLRQQLPTPLKPTNGA